MSKLKKFHFNFLKVEWSIGCLEVRLFEWSVMSECMPSKIIFIHLQISKIRFCNIQIMKNFVVSLWQKLFCFDFGPRWRRANEIARNFFWQNSGKRWHLIGLFWILAGRKNNTTQSNFVQNFQKMPKSTKQIQKWQFFYSRSWLTRIFCRFLQIPDFNSTTILSILKLKSLEIIVNFPYFLENQLQGVIWKVGKEIFQQFKE